MDDIHSVRFQFIYTEVQQKTNRRAYAEYNEAHHLILAAEMRNAVMAPIMDAIAQNFVCCQYEDVDPAPFKSSQWDFFFWCNDFRNTLHGSGLSGRDYSYFTLTCNENQTVEKRAEVCGRLLQFLERRWRENCNLDVAVQYSIWYDRKKIAKDASRMKHLLDGRSYSYDNQNGKFLLDGGALFYRPKYAKRRIYCVSDMDVLTACWNLGLTDDDSESGPLFTMSRHSA